MQVSIPLAIKCLSILDWSAVAPSQFLICLALCVAVAQAGYLAAPVATYAATPLVGATTYAAAAAPVATYAAPPLTTTYSAAAVPVAYTRSVYAAPAYAAPVATYAAPVTTYAAPAIVSPFLKRK